MSEKDSANETDRMAPDSGTPDKDLAPSFEDVWERRTSLADLDDKLDTVLIQIENLKGRFRAMEVGVIILIAVAAYFRFR